MMANRAQKCKGVTRKNTPCNRPPMKGCDYCYAHSTKHFKGVTWWKSPVLHFIIAIIVSVSLFLIGPSRKNQEKVLAGQTNIQTNINELREFLQETQKSLHDRLLKDYLLGYGLFYSDGKRFVYQDYKSKIINIDWSAVRIELNEKYIRVTLPTWRLIQSGSIFQGNRYDLEREAGKTIGRNRFKIGATAFPVVECIAADENSVVVAVGFDKES